MSPRRALEKCLMSVVIFFFILELQLHSICFIDKLLGCGKCDERSYQKFQGEFPAGGRLFQNSSVLAMIGGAATSYYGATYVILTTTRILYSLWLWLAVSGYVYMSEIDRRYSTRNNHRSLSAQTRSGMVCY